MILDPIFYNRDTVEVARDLIGKKLVRVIGDDRIAAMITETEAYRSDDPACHAHRGKTARNAPLFGPVGHTYVYFTYGMHFCLNIVARDVDNFPSGGVLLRGLLPIEGHDTIKKFRPKHSSGLLNGPAIITQALNIDRSATGWNVTSGSSLLFIAEGIPFPEHFINTTPRIGISRAQEKLWRYVVKAESIAQIPKLLQQA